MKSRSDRGREPSFFLFRTAREVRRYALWMRVMGAAALVLAALLTVVYLISALYSKTGSFTVRIDRFEMERYALSLSETPDFLYPAGVLSADVSEHITNISGEDLPEDLDAINGAHSGDNYLAYTFYLTNAGTEPVTVEYEIRLTNVTRELDSALRLRLYTDGEAVTYAKTRRDGGGAEAGCVEFLTETVVLRGRMEGFLPGNVKKYTVVMWLEGNDADCVDALIGGTLKTAMTFSVIEDHPTDTAIGD